MASRISSKSTHKHRYPVLSVVTTSKHKLTAEAPEPVAKRVRKESEPILKEHVAHASRETPKLSERVSQPATRRPLIEDSPPSSPLVISSGSVEKKELDEFEKAFELFRGAEYESSQEARVASAEDAENCLSIMLESENSYRQDAEYYLAWTAWFLARSNPDLITRIGRLNKALRLFKIIKDPTHPYYLRAKYWQAACCYELGLLEEGPKYKRARFTKAQKIVSIVITEEKIYHEEAIKLHEQCNFQIDRLPKDKSIAFGSARSVQ